MGGCATKPKVLKGDEGEVPSKAPAPPPEPTKEPVPAVPEAKETAAAVAEGEKKAEEDAQVNELVVLAKDADIAEAKEVDLDEANKRQSLSILFKENEKKGSAESDSTPSEPLKESVEPAKQESVVPVQTESVEPVKEKEEPVKQGTLESEKPKEASAAVNPEIEKPVNTTEETSKPALVSAPAQTETEKTMETTPVPEPAPAVNVPQTQNKETSADNKEDKTEVAK